MLPLQHEDAREFKDIPTRELLATALQEEVKDTILDLTQAALLHCVAMPSHDDMVRSLATKLNEFVLGFVGTDEGHCTEAVLAALNVVTIEHISRMQQDGEIDDFLKGKIN